MAWAALVKEGSGEQGKNSSSGLTILDIGVGHTLSAFQDILGPITTVSAFGSVAYPTFQVVNENMEPVGEPQTGDAYDHIAFAGTLESGVFANIEWKTGYATTKGRRQILWEIQGDKGVIRMENSACEYCSSMRERDLLTLAGSV